MSVDAVSSPTTTTRAVVSGPWGSAQILGTGVALPAHGMRTPDDLLRPGPPSEFDAAAALGRKGLRYKDRATLLAASAAESALRAAGLASAERQPSRDVGLVVASCYGNLATVCGVAEQIDRGGVAAVSPMDLPNASTNVVASTIAIRNGLRGVCLTIGNGHRSGWDALRWALALLESGRSRRVVVVGVEVPSTYERQLRGGAPLVDGAVSVVVGRSEDVAMPPAVPPVPSPRGHDGAEPLLPGWETAAVGGVLDVAWAAREVSATGRAVEVAAPDGRSWVVAP